MSTTALIVITIFLIIIAYLWFAGRRMKNMPLVAEHENIVTLTDSNIQHQLKSGLALVDFWAAWCMPCKMMAPIINEVAEESTGKAKICKLDVQQYQALSAKYSVRSIPTLILFKDGKEINRFVGVKTKEFLLKEIAKVS